MQELSKFRLVAQVVLVTVGVLVLFGFVRSILSERQLSRDLQERAEIVASRISASSTPTIWNIFEKSVERRYSSDVASAILDSELTDRSILAIIVTGNFGHVFMGKVRLPDGTVAVYDRASHRERLKAADASVSKPIRQGPMTIGQVKVLVTSEPFTRSSQRALLFDIAQVVVVSVILLASLLYVIERTVMVPARAMAVARQAFESIGSALVVTDAHGRIVDANDAYQDFSGQREGWAGKLLTLPFRKTGDTADFTQALTSQDQSIPFDGEFDLELSPDERKPVRVRMSPLLDGERNRTPYKVTTIRDITREKQEEENLQHLVQEASRLGQLAEQANQAKSEFLATMSHELRTPLNAIIGFSEMMLIARDGLPAEKIEDYNQSVLSSGKHLLSLINDILDLSKVDAGKMELDREEFDLLELMRECAGFLEPACQKADIRIVIDVEPLTLYSDQRLMKQILINLLSNAVKFSPAGSAVEVASRITAPDCLSLSVSDHGIGMTEQEVHRAMEPFVQLEESYNRTVEGTGLGLPLVSRFAKLLDIDFRIESEPGKGTTAHLDIPLTSDRDVP
jgi:PAS domain S-box-containing protein